VALQLEPTDGPTRVEATDDAVVVHLSADAARAIAGKLKPKRGTYRFDGLVVEVVPTPILDRDGRVVETLG
jgi:hypothetical protein